LAQVKQAFQELPNCTIESINASILAHASGATFRPKINSARTFFPKLCYNSLLSKDSVHPISRAEENFSPLFRALRFAQAVKVETFFPLFGKFSVLEAKL
jgi:hypothetical protein